MSRNEFWIDDSEVVHVALHRLSGETLYTLVDIVDLAKVLAFPGKWSTFWDRTAHTYYATGNVSRTIIGWKDHPRWYLHRWLLQPRAGLVVDHINFNGLDNRRKNLRIGTQAMNRQNLQPDKRNTSGIRGVSWHSIGHKWRARIKLNGREIHLGLFDNLADAEHAVKSARRRYMPFSPEGDGRDA